MYASSRMRGSNRRAAAAKLVEPRRMLSRLALSTVSFNSLRLGQHKRGGGLGRTDHARHARSGVRSRTHDIEIVDHVVPVVRPKPGALVQDRLKRKGRAKMSVQHIAKIEWREHPAGNQVVR